MKELTTDRQGATEAEIAQLQARREKHAHVNPFFLSCTRRNEHRASDFSPMSRFSKDELDQAIIDMEALLTEKSVDGASPGDKTAEKSPDSAAHGVRNGVSKRSASEGASAGASDSPNSTVAANGTLVSGTSNGVAKDASEKDTTVGSNKAEQAPGASSAPEDPAGATPAKTPDSDMSLQLTKTSLDSPSPPEPPSIPCELYSGWRQRA